MGGLPIRLPLLNMTRTEMEITAKLVRGLLREQHPDLADYPVRLGARGWDNPLWRLGDDLAVRLPWATQSADALLRKEHTWLPALAPRLPSPVPVPQRFRHRHPPLRRVSTLRGEAHRPLSCDFRMKRSYWCRTSPWVHVADPCNVPRFFTQGNHSARM
jgi:hypothetical protein